MQVPLPVPSQPMNYNIVFDEGAVNLVLKALSKLTYEESAGLIGGIQQICAQQRQQMAEAAARAARETTDQPKENENGKGQTERGRHPAEEGDGHGASEGAAGSAGQQAEHGETGEQVRHVAKAPCRSPQRIELIEAERPE